MEKFRGIGIAHFLADGRIFDCVVRHCHTGVRLPSSDTEISRCRLYNCRDACLWIAKDSGNCQSLNNHCYGARIACYNEGGFPFRATNDTYADAFIGYLGTGASDQTVLTNCLFQHNTTRDVVFTAGGCHLIGCVINVQREVADFTDFLAIPPNIPAFLDKVGVQIDGERCSIRGGVVELTPFKHPSHNFPMGNPPSEGIWISGDLCTVETTVFDDDGIDGTVGIKVRDARKGVRIDCHIRGFEGTNDRILKFTGTGKNSQGLDITIRGDFAKDIMNVTPSETDGVEKYIDIATGTWTGTIKFIDTGNGATRTLTPNAAY